MNPRLARRRFPIGTACISPTPWAIPPVHCAAVPIRPWQRRLHSARVSVDIAVLDLNLWSIRDALLEAYDRGVLVRMVVESDYLDTDEVQELKDAGIPVLGDRQEGLMHNKFVIIDRQEVWTGSMNFTISDTYQNNNNLQRIRSSRLAEDYTAEFEEMFTG